MGKHLMLFKMGFLLWCDVWWKCCRGRRYLGGHISLFVLLFIYYILVRLGQLQSECNFCDVTFVCDDEQIKTHKFVFSSLF